MNELNGIQDETNNNIHRGNEKKKAMHHDNSIFQLATTKSFPINTLSFAHFGLFSLLLLLFFSLAQMNLSWTLPLSMCLKSFEMI